MPSHIPLFVIKVPNKKHALQNAKRVLILFCCYQLLPTTSFWISVASTTLITPSWL